MVPETQAGERYATQVGELWSGLSQTLARLEAIALAPERLDDEDMVDALRRLQYSLHSASERCSGSRRRPAPSPPTASWRRRSSGARDATGEVVEAVERRGAAASTRCVYEWRGALFRVRLARLRLTGAAARSGAERAERCRSSAHRLGALGAHARRHRRFALGATFGLWPLWVAGVVAVCVSLLLYRPVGR